MKKITKTIGVLLFGYLPNLCSAQFTCEGSKTALYKQQLCSDSIQTVLERMLCVSAPANPNPPAAGAKCTVDLIAGTANGENTFGAFLNKLPGNFFNIPSPINPSNGAFCSWSVVNTGFSIQLQVAYSPNSPEQLAFCKEELSAKAGNEKICANVIVSEDFNCFPGTGGIKPLKRR